MAVSVLIVLLIAVYCFWVIRKKVKDAKNGRFCSCGCQDCSSKCNSFSEK
ncbi:MAG: FeoB-associated Cys-rich membrane protein [Lachnospiraceae bacterium]|nr:FeoB-associated Cys-rich membrane protein [Lachnospiraceae bacterium]